MLDDYIIITLLSRVPSFRTDDYSSAAAILRDFEEFVQMSRKTYLFHLKKCYTKL